MKVEIPDNLKADMPQTTWGKILSATPVIMAVLSTMLAGLASSEMTRAQYARSLASQEQSKAGDQWSFFQAKRLRGALQRNTGDLIQSVAPVTQLDPDELKTAVGSAPQAVREDAMKVIESPSVQQALGFLAKGELPPLPPAPQADPLILKAIHGVEDLQTEAELAPLLAKISDRDLADAIRKSQDHAQALDEITTPINKGIDQADAVLARISPTNSNGAPSIYRNFTSARLRFTALRYETEARINQSIANLYELQVRKSNISAQRHHIRSQRFFFGMLASQAGVIISTFAMAARKRNFLWSIAAAAGLIAVAFAVYVYLFI